MTVCTVASADSISFSTDHWVTATGERDIPITNLEFSFDQIPTGAVIGPGESWTMIQDGVLVEVSRPGSWLEIVDTTPFNVSNFGAGAVPDDWGEHVLSPFIDYMNPAEMEFTVTIPLGFGLVGMAIDVGDFGGGGEFCRAAGFRLVLVVFFDLRQGGGVAFGVHHAPDAVDVEQVGD